MKLSNEIKTAILVLSGILMFIVGFSYLKSNNIFSSDRTFFAIYDDIEGIIFLCTLTDYAIHSC